MPDISRLLPTRRSLQSLSIGRASPSAMLSISFVAPSSLLASSPCPLPDNPTRSCSPHLRPRLLFCRRGISSFFLRDRFASYFSVPCRPAGLPPDRTLFSLRLIAYFPPRPTDRALSRYQIHRSKSLRIRCSSTSAHFFVRAHLVLLVLEAFHMLFFSFCRLQRRVPLEVVGSRTAVCRLSTPAPVPFCFRPNFPILPLTPLYLSFSIERPSRLFHCRMLPISKSAGVFSRRSVFLFFSILEFSFFCALSSSPIFSTFSSFLLAHLFPPTSPIFIPVPLRRSSRGLRGPPRLASPEKAVQSPGSFPHRATLLLPLLRLASCAFFARCPRSSRRHAFPISRLYFLHACPRFFSKHLRVPPSLQPSALTTLFFFLPFLPNRTFFLSAGPLGQPHRIPPARYFRRSASSLRAHACFRSVGAFPRPLFFFLPRNLLYSLFRQRPHSPLSAKSSQLRRSALVRPFLLVRPASVSFLPNLLVKQTTKLWYFTVGLPLPHILHLHFRSTLSDYSKSSAGSSFPTDFSSRPFP
jgi:hypothetical protein